MWSRTFVSLLASIQLVQQGMTFTHAHEDRDGHDVTPHVHFCWPWSADKLDDHADGAGRENGQEEESPRDPHDYEGPTAHVGRVVTLNARAPSQHLSDLLAADCESPSFFVPLAEEPHHYSHWPHAPPFFCYSELPLFLSFSNLLL
jgi:hypothetical protein